VIIKRALIVATVLLLLMSIILSACSGGQAENGGGELPDTDEGAVTLSAAGVQDKLYFGTLSPPNKGFVALFVHHDNLSEILVVATNNMTFSAYMTGELKGQTLNATNENETAKALGRPVGTTGFELNLTYPGAGTMRSELKESSEGALYTGTSNDLLAGLLVMPDGTVNGIAAVSGGDKPTYEYLCPEDDALADLPDQVTVKTCDTEEEIVLDRIKD
jgi:hypothetical protein